MKPIASTMNPCVLHEFTKFSDAVIIDEVHHLANHFVLIHLTDLEIGTDVYVSDNLNVR